MESNPYSSPSSNLFGSSGSTVAEAVSQGTISHLQRTKLWVRIMSVVLFISAAMMLVMGVLLATMGSLAGSMFPVSQSANNPAFQAGFGIGMGTVYAIFGLLYLYPAIKLWKYGSKIVSLVRSRTVVDLEAALNEQRGFWKFAGVMTLIFFGLAILMMAFGVVAAVMAAGAASAM